MIVKVCCSNPECGATSSVGQGELGRTVRCKKCGAKFVLTPTTDATAAKATQDARGADTSRMSRTPVLQSKPAKAKRPSAPIRPALSMPGKIGRFEIRSKLGAGAFGTVYLAYDPQLDREVALKVPHPGMLDSPYRINRFLREAKSAAQLRHPNIVPVFDAGKDGDHYYIAQAFIAGQPLANLIKEGGMDFTRAARIVHALAEATGYAHSLGIVHRDIKPANIMIDKQHRPHLMDFGLAARLDSMEKITHDGAVIGTPAYMAPEQAKGQKGEAQPAADQYSLGVVLYELLCGQPPS